MTLQITSLLGEPESVSNVAVVKSCSDIKLSIHAMGLRPTSTSSRSANFGLYKKASSQPFGPPSRLARLTFATLPPICYAQQCASVILLGRDCAVSSLPGHELQPKQVGSSWRTKIDILIVSDSTLERHSSEKHSGIGRKEIRYGSYMR